MTNIRQFQWYNTGPPVFRDVYLYLQSRIAIEYADDARKALGEKISTYIDVLSLGNTNSWKDGALFKFQIKSDATDLAEELRAELNLFEHWAVFDDRGNYKESIDSGPFSTFLKSIVNTRGPNLFFSQLCIKWREEHPWINNTVKKLRDSLNKKNAPVFYFRDGQIILIDTNEPGNITRQRCQRIARDLFSWRVIDSAQEVYSSRGREDKAWDPADLLEVA